MPDRIVIPCVAITYAGRLLLLQRGHKRPSIVNMWCIPGGKIENGESPMMAASREMREETGIDYGLLDTSDVQPIMLLGDFDSSALDDAGQPYRLRVFLVAFNNKPPTIRIEPQFNGFGWFNWREMNGMRGQVMAPAIAVAQALGLDG